MGERSEIWKKERIRLADVIPSRAVSSIAAACFLVAASPLFGFEIISVTNAYAAGFVALMAGVGIAYDQRRDEPRIAVFFVTLAIWFAGSWLWGMLNVAALGMGAPLQDARLAAIDAALGLDHRALVAWVAHRPGLANLLLIVYLFTVPANLALAIFLPMFGQFERTRRFIGDFALLLAITIVISAFVPGGGSFYLEPYPAEVLSNLPPRAGVMHLLRYDETHQGAMRILDLTNMAGVATFPSFHVAMALFIARAFWGVLWLRPLGVTAAALIIVSTIPIGGHYFVDILATLALYAAFCVSPWRLRAPARGEAPQLHRPLVAAR